MPSVNWGSPTAGSPYTLIDWSENEMVHRQYQPAEHIKEITDEVHEFGRKSQDEKSTPLGTRYAGSVPITIYMNWLKDWKKSAHKYFSQDTFMAIKFNDSEYADFRDDRIVVPKDAR